MTTSDAIIKKLSKKTKMGEYDPYEVVDAINEVEPGWKIEESVEAMPVKDGKPIKVDSKTFEKQHKATSASFGYYSPSEFSFAWSFGGERMKDHYEPTDADVKAAIDDMMGQIKSQVTVAKDPMNPKPGEVFVASIPKPKVERSTGDHGMDHTTVYVSLKLPGLKVGIPATKITSPKGDIIKLQGKNSPTLWTMLYRTDIADKAKAYLDTPEVAQKNERIELLKSVGDKVGKLGTCAICANHQMLNRNRLDKDGNPTMVLHGYKRPGVGYVIGDCFGVGYAPYELSAEACEKWRDELVTMMANQEKKIAGLKTATKIKDVYVAVRDNNHSYEPDKMYQRVVLMKDGTIEDLGESLNRTELRRLEIRGHDVVRGQEKALFDLLKASAVQHAEQQLKFMDLDHKTMIRKIKDWSLQPLPGTGKEDAELIERQKAKLCPGSGTTNHDAAHTGNHYSWWAKCNVCGQTVTVNKSSNKMRAHAPAKVKAMTASMRIDEVAEKLLTFTTPEKIRAAVEEAADLLAKLK